MVDLTRVRTYIEDILFPYYPQLQSTSKSFRESLFKEMEKIEFQKTPSYKLSRRQIRAQNYMDSRAMRSKSKRLF